MEHSGFRFFQLEKSPLLFRKSGVFVHQKGSPIFIFCLSIWSLDEVKLLKFGTFRISIFPIGKKSTFVPKFGGFGGPKRFSNFYYFFLNMKLRWNKIIEIWNIPDSNFSNWKKIHFCPEIWGKILEKKLLWFCSKLAQMRFKQYKFILIWNIPNSDFSNWKKVQFKFFEVGQIFRGFPL